MKLSRLSKFVIFASVSALGFCGYVQPACAAPKKAAAAVAESPTGVALLFPPMANDATAKQKKARAAILRKLQAIQGGADINATDGKGQTALMCAVALNERLAACWLVAKGADVTLKSAAGKTALDYATDDALYELLEECMHENEPALSVRPRNIRDIGGLAESLKHNKAVTFKNCFPYPEKMAYIVRHGAAVEISPDMYTNSFVEIDVRLPFALGASSDDINLLLNHALLVDDIPTIKKLLAEHKDTLSLTTPGRGSFPLIRSAQSGEAVRALVAAGMYEKNYYNVEMEPFEPDFVADSIQTPDVIQALLDTGTKIKDIYSLIQEPINHFSDTMPWQNFLRNIFAKKKCPANALNLLRGTPSTDKKIATHNRIVKFLMSQGAVLGNKSLQNKDTGKDFSNDILIPFYAGRYDVGLAKRILAGGFDPKQKNNKEQTLLFTCPSPEVAKLLIAAGVDVKAKDKQGRTALHRAAEHGTPAYAEFLIKQGLDVHAKDASGRTPLHQVESPAMVEMLIRHGADVNAKDADGYTPLIRDWPIEDIALIEVLVKAGADINYQDKEGFTLLMKLCKLDSWASSSKRAKIVDALLRMGARTDLRNKKGKTAFDIAKENTHPALIRVFNAHGVKE